MEEKDDKIKKKSVQMSSACGLGSEYNLYVQILEEN